MVEYYSRQHRYETLYRTQRLSDRSLWFIDIVRHEYGELPKWWAESLLCQCNLWLRISSGKKLVWQTHSYPTAYFFCRLDLIAGSKQSYLNCHVCWDSSNWNQIHSRSDRLLQHSTSGILAWLDLRMISWSHGIWSLGFYQLSIHREKSINKPVAIIHWQLFKKHLLLPMGNR